MTAHAWPHPYAEVRRVEPASRAITSVLCSGIGDGARSVARLLDVRGKLVRVPCGALAVLDRASIDASGRLVVVTENCPGESAERLRTRGVIPIARAVRIIAAVIDALGAAHAAGVFHRALSLASVVVDGDDARVIDFGLGELIGPESPHATLRLVALSPERIFGLPPAAPEDVYLLGCVAYHLMAGDPPLVDDDAARLRRRHAIEDPPRLPRTGPQAVPTSLARVIEKCLAKEPDERYESMAALAEAWSAAAKDVAAAPIVAAPKRAVIGPPPVLGPAPAPARPVSLVVPRVTAPPAPAPRRDPSERSGATLGAVAAAAAASERSGARPPIPRASERSGATLGAVAAAAAASERSGAKRAPVIEAPVIAAPVIEAPVIAMPVIEAPVIATPVIEAPVIEAPVIATPVIGAPSIEAPVAASLVPASRPLLTAPTGAHEIAAAGPPPSVGPRRRGIVAAVAVASVALAAIVAWPRSEAQLSVSGAPGARSPEPASSPTIDPSPEPASSTPIGDPEPTTVIVHSTAGLAPAPAFEPTPSLDAEPPAQEVEPTMIAASAGGSDPIVAELIARASDARRSGRSADAIASYQQALAIQPKNLDALSAMARIYFDRGAFDDAVVWGRRLVAAAPGSAKARLALGDAYFKLGKPADARTQYRKAAKLGHRLAASRLEAVGDAP